MKSVLLPTFALSLLLGATAATARVTEKFTETYPLDANGTIHLENINGSVEIVAWDKPEVALEAEKSANSSEALARIHLRIDSTPRRLEVKTDFEKKWKFWDNMNAQVHYKLMVPAGAALDKISAVNANIQVDGVQGEVELETVNGNIEATGLGSRGEFETVNGSIRITYTTLPASGPVSLETINGSCRLILPDDAAFDLETETINGRINCDFPITLKKSGKRELKGSVNGGGARVTLESVNGSLTIERAK